MHCTLDVIKIDSIRYTVIAARVSVIPFIPDTVCTSSLGSHRKEYYSTSGVCAR